jgi:hypothetical protein
MFMPSRNLLAVLLFLCVSSLFAQSVLAQEPQSPNQAQTASEEQQSEPTAAAREAPEMPMPLFDASSLEFTSEMSRSNYLQLGVGTGVNYDDNVLNAATTRIGAFSYNVTPNIRLDISRRRLFFEFSYAGGYTVNQRFSAYNTGSHNASVDLKYRLSPHVTFQVRDNFIRSSVLPGQFQGDIPGASTGVIVQPNLGIITPLAIRQTNLGEAQITYRYSAGDMIGAKGTFYQSRYSQVSGPTSLLNTSSQEGTGFYTHRFSARNWSGISYSFQRLTFNPGSEEANIHSINLFHTIYLQRHMTLGFFAGPEYTELHSQVVATSITLPFVSVVSDPLSRQTWTVSGGATFSWQGNRTSIEASGARKVSDGGGLQTGVTTISGSGSLRRKLSRYATVDLGASYSHNRSLQQGGSAFYLLNVASGSIVWEQHFTPKLFARIGYGRDYQQQNLTATSALDINHNRGWVTLGYQFTKALGR